MAINFGYVHLLNGEAFRSLLTLRAAERDMLDDVFQSLADNPFLRGDYHEPNVHDHATEVLLQRRFVLTFRVDHAAKEVRILRVERV